MSKEISPLIQSGIATFLEEAKNFEIIDSESLEKASCIAINIKRFRTKTVQADLMPPKEAAAKAHKAACVVFNKHVNPLLAAEKQLTTKIYAYEQNIKIIRQEAAAKAQREAEEAAWKERDRLDTIALEAADKGDNEAFTHAEAEKEMVSEHDYLPITAREEKLPTGVSTRKNWQFEITDLLALFRAVQAGTAPMNFIIADVKVIGKWAKAVGNTHKVPGIRVYDKGTVSLNG